MPKKTFLLLVPIVLLAFFGAFLSYLQPVDGEGAESGDFEITEGEGFLSISHRLYGAGFIRSPYAFEFLALFTGSAGRFKPGIYALNPSRASFEILSELTIGPHREILLRIPEGASVYEIDGLLGDAGIIEKGGLINLSEKENLEGIMFPDTYRFFKKSDVEDVAEKLTKNFKKKTSEILKEGGDYSVKDILIMASLVEKEVPDHEERRIVAGIIKKRLRVGMPLQIDATICYIKKIQGYPRLQDCHPLSRLDFGVDSQYNTYLYKGLPPGPIGNPGISAISAVVDSVESPYWFYLSDQETKDTIFSETIEEHNENRAKYLGL